MGEMTKIVVKRSGDPDARTFQDEYDFGANLQEAVEIFGEDVVFGTFNAQAKILRQGFIRRLLKADKSDAEIIEAGKAWKLGVATRKPAKSPVEKVQDLIAGMSPEQREQLKKLLAAKKAA